MRINPATAPNAKPQPTQETHFDHICRPFTFIEKMYIILQKVHNQSVKNHFKKVYVHEFPALDI